MSYYPGPKQHVSMLETTQRKNAGFELPSDTNKDMRCILNASKTEDQQNNKLTK